VPEMERFWIIRDTEHGKVIVPKKPILCPICGEVMLLHDFACYKHTSGFKHADIHVKCPYCSFWATFGVPISEEEFEELTKSPLHKQILKWELTNLVDEEVRGDLEARLKKWGYW